LHTSPHYNPLDNKNIVSFIIKLQLLNLFIGSLRKRLIPNNYPNINLSVWTHLSTSLRRRFYAFYREYFYKPEVNAKEVR